MNLISIEPIAQGGFGSVDLVQGLDGKRYARKTFSQNQPLSPELLQNVLKRFAKEVRIQGGINHPNIVPIIGSDLSIYPPFYLMPLADASLAKDIASDRQLGGNFISALSDIVAGLEVLHAMQIYHRDLKPQNVLRFPGGIATGGRGFYAISDFGLISLRESQLSALTSTGMARGSDYYTAPEVTQDLSRASACSDVYSLGCILHDIVGTDERVPCGEIREAGPFAAILLGCTKKNPQQRFKSAKAVLDAILSVDLEIYQPAVQASIDFIVLLDGSAPLSPDTWERLADFIEYGASTSDKHAIYMKLGADKISSLCAVAPSTANRMAVNYSSWIQESSFNFDYCDGLANRLEIFFSHCDFEAKSSCLMALLEMGVSHNRWYVEQKFISLCGHAMDVNLAARLAVEFRIAGAVICRRIDHLERSISTSRQYLHPTLSQTLGQICA